MTKFFQPIALAVLATSCLAAGPTYCVDDFAKGCQLYGSKNYSQAEPLFVATVKKYPNFWQGHYYLAHTLLAEGKRAQAKAEYEAVQGCKPAPGADIVTACQKVLASLGGGGVPAAGVAAGTPTASAAPANPGKDDDGDDKGKAGVPLGRDMQRTAQIERLRQECNAKVDALREEMNQAIVDGKVSGNHRYLYPDGTIGVDMNSEEKAVIHQDYANRIHQVQDDYQRRIAAIH